MAAVFRISFYPEYRALVRERRRKRTMFLTLCGFVALEAIAVGTLAVSGALLTEQQRELRRSIERLNVRVDQAPIASPTVERARELVTLRTKRIDWAPKLEAISGAIPPTLRLEELNGRVAAKRTPPELILEGRVKNDVEPLESVSSFLEELRRDSRMTRDYPVIELGALKGREGSEFEIVCRVKRTEES